MKTPVVIVTGYLGSGKTTLLRKIIDESEKKLAIIMNEFGELGIDGTVIKGRNIDMIELSGGCVCCSMTGELEAAVREIMEKVKPDSIIIETTGVAEPDALVDDISQNLPQVRLDSIVTIVDADAMHRFPSIGHTGRVQIEMGDIILINKTDLVDKEVLAEVHNKIKELNNRAMFLEAVRCNVDTSIIFDTKHGTSRSGSRNNHLAEENVSYFTYEGGTMDTEKFSSFIEEIPENIYRAKGFVVTKEGTLLFSYVAGRHEFEEFSEREKTELVFIGKGIGKIKNETLKKLKRCEIK